MGRLSPPIGLPTEPRTPEQPAPSIRPPRQTRTAMASTLRNRSLLLVAAIATVSGVLLATLNLTPPPRPEPELARLLKGMVLIKGLIGLMAAALVLWRMGGPIERPVALGYGAAICVSLGAVAWLWSLHSIPLGGLLFWSGLVGIVLVARRDGLIGEMARRRV